MYAVDFKEKEMAVSQGFEPQEALRLDANNQDNQQLSISAYDSKRLQKPPKRHQNDTALDYPKICPLNRGELACQIQGCTLTNYDLALVSSIKRQLSVRKLVIWNLKSPKNQ